MKTSVLAAGRVRTSAAAATPRRRPQRYFRDAHGVERRGHADGPVINAPSQGASSLLAPLGAALCLSRARPLLSLVVSNGPFKRIIPAS